MGCGTCSKCCPQYNNPKPPIDKVLLSVSTQYPERPSIKVEPYSPFDLTRYDSIFTDIDFSDLLIIEEKEFYDIKEEWKSLEKSIKQSHNIIPNNDAWNENYVAHGDSTDVVTEVTIERHACVKHLESQEIDIEAQLLNLINKRIEEIFNQRIQLIRQREDERIKQHIRDRKSVQKHIINNAQCYTAKYETQYKRLLEEYIAKLEKRMILCLDELHKNVQHDQECFFDSSQAYIERITLTGQNVTKDLVESINTLANRQIHQIITEGSKSYRNQENQPCGREELRTTNISTYSTVRQNNQKIVCDNIKDRQKYIDEITQTKSNHQIKRTVYLGSNPCITIPRP